MLYRYVLPKAIKRFILLYALEKFISVRFFQKSHVCIWIKNFFLENSFFILKNHSKWKLEFWNSVHVWRNKTKDILSGFHYIICLNHRGKDVIHRYNLKVIRRFILLYAIGGFLYVRFIRKSYVYFWIKRAIFSEFLFYSQKTFDMKIKNSEIRCSF